MSCHFRSFLLAPPTILILWEIIFVPNGISLCFLFFTKKTSETGERDRKREGEHTISLTFPGITILLCYQDNAIRKKKKKIDVSLGTFCRWSYKSTEKWNKKISWHPSFPDKAKIPALTWSRRGREHSLFLQRTEMQGVFVFCYQQRVVMSLLSVR